METVKKWQLTALVVLVIVVAVLVVVVFAQQGTRKAENAALRAEQASQATTAPRPTAAPAEPGLPADTLVFFAGDSLSDGWYATTEEQGFRPLVQDAVRGVAPEADFFGAHQAGYTVQQVAEEFDIPEGADIAVIELGTNDVTKGTDLNVFPDQYAAYLDEVMTASPDAQLVCLGSFAASDARAGSVDGAIKAACDAHGGEYIDLTGVYTAEGLRGPAGTSTWLGPADNGHPNDAGHKRIADLVVDRLEL